MMKLRALTLACTLALASSGLLADETAATAAAAEAMPIPSGDTEIATINGYGVTLDLFRQYFAERANQTGSQNTPQFQNRAFNEMIAVIVTAQDAEGQGLDKVPGFETALELARLQLLSKLAMASAAQTRQPSAEDLQAAYDARYANQDRTEYRARHILVAEEDQAKQLIVELDGGADFAELAKAHSTGPTGKKGGDLGWFGRSQMVKPFSDAVAAMEPGAHTEEPVQTQFGWHVIMLEEVRETEPPKLEDVRGELARGMQREILSGYVAELRGAADIEVNAELTTQAPAEPAAPATE